MVRLDNQDVPPAVLQFKGDIGAGKAAGDKGVAAPAAAPPGAAMPLAPAYAPAAAPSCSSVPDDAATVGEGVVATRGVEAANARRGSTTASATSGDPAFDAAAVAKLLVAERK